MRGSLCYDLFALTSLVYVNVFILGDIGSFQKCNKPIHIWILVSFYFLICERFAMNYYTFLKKYIAIFTYLLFFFILTGHILWTIIGTAWYLNEESTLSECLGDSLGHPWKMKALLGLNYLFLLGVSGFLIMRAFLIHRFGYDDFPIIENGFVDPAQYLTDDELKRIPLRKMDSLTNVRDTECTICFSNIKPNEFARQMPKCNHVFHNKCIVSWLKIKGCCPNCKANVKQIVQ